MVEIYGTLEINVFVGKVFGFLLAEMIIPKTS